MTGSSTSNFEQPCTERRIAALLTANPDLSPGGYWTDDYANEYGRRHQFDLDRESASVCAIHVEGFEWSRTFLTLACRRLSSVRSRKSIKSDDLVPFVEVAAERALGRHVQVGNGIVIIAAMSLGIHLEQAGGGPNARIAVRVIRDGRE